MIKIRKSNQRGLAQHGWLKSLHTFSFADYYDPAFMGYGVLRVINEDRIAGGSGFGLHGHRDMEIISYVIAGALEHKDSMGTETVILPGDIQRMSAGLGVKHSEFNKIPDKETHFLQIWIMPDRLGLKPGYEQKSFAKDFEKNDLVLVASKTGKKGSITLNQDVDLYVCKSCVSGESRFSIQDKRHLWVQVVKGQVTLEQDTLEDGDAASIEGVTALRLKWEKGAEFLLFDLPQ